MYLNSNSEIMQCLEGKRITNKHITKINLAKGKKLQPCKVGGVPGLGQAGQYCTVYIQCR